MENLLSNGADINTPDMSIQGCPDTTILMETSRIGNLDAVKVLLNNGADINIADDHGMTAFMFACGAGHYSIAWQLWKAGTDIHAIDKDDTNALMLACVNGHLGIVRLFHDKIDAQAKNRIGYTALDIAKRYNHAEIIRILEDMKYDDLIDAIDSRALDKVKSIIDDQDIDVNVGIRFSTHPVDWYLLLHAVHSGGYDIVEFLLEKGANPNVTDSGGVTPLHLAYGLALKEIVNLLLKHGADVRHINEPSKGGCTAHERARQLGRNDLF